MKSGDRTELKKTEKKGQIVNGNTFFNGNEDVLGEILRFLPIHPAYSLINKRTAKAYAHFFAHSGQELKNEFLLKKRKQMLANRIERLKRELGDDSISLQVPDNKEAEEKLKSEFERLRYEYSGCDLGDTPVNRLVLLLAVLSIVLLVIAGSHDSNMTISGSVLLLSAILMYFCHKSYRNHAFQEISDALESLMEEKKSTVQPTRILNEKTGDAEKGTSTELRGIFIHSLHHHSNTGNTATATRLTSLFEKKEEKNQNQNQNQCQQSMSSSGRPYS